MALTATNAFKAKNTLYGLIKQILEASPDTATVDVNYAYDGRADTREQVHFDHVEGTQTYATLGHRPRLSRDETLTVKIHIVVRHPGDTQNEAEQRATEIGTVIEEFLASPTNQAAIDGLTWAGITGVFLDGDGDDNGAFALLSYDVEVNSRLT